MNENMLDVDLTDFFDLTKEEQREAIKMGAELLLQELGFNQLLTGKTFQVILSSTMANLEAKIEIAKLNEKYELCYYLEEVKWEIVNQLK